MNAKLSFYYMNKLLKKKKFCLKFANRSLFFTLNVDFQWFRLEKFLFIYFWIDFLKLKKLIFWTIKSTYSFYFKNFLVLIVTVNM